MGAPLQSSLPVAGELSTVGDVCDDTMVAAADLGSDRTNLSTLLRCFPAKNNARPPMVQMKTNFTVFPLFRFVGAGILMMEAFSQ